MFGNWVDCVVLVCVMVHAKYRIFFLFQLVCVVLFLFLSLFLLVLMMCDVLEVIDSKLKVEAVN